MFKKIEKIISISVFVLYPVYFSYSTTYYISTSGSDITGDGSSSNPWRTIQKAANAVVAGDTVIIRAGTYNEQVTITKAGTASSPITFQGESLSNMPVIDGQNTRDWCIYIDGSSSPGDKYITIENIKVQNAVRDGIRISMADHVTIRNCVASNNTLRGIFTDYTYYTLVENCESYGAKNEHGIYFSNSCRYPTARGNVIHDNAACGIHNNGDASMTARSGSDGVNRYGLIERNIIYKNGTSGGGAGINMDGCEDYIVRNNLVYDNYASGITSYKGDGASSKNNKIYNNTIYFPAGQGRSGILLNSSTGNTIVNNILVCGKTTGYGAFAYTLTSDLNGLTMTNNLLFNSSGSSNDIWVESTSTTYTLSNWQSLTGKGSNCIVANPSFVSASDFHLTSFSPGVDKGILISGLTDDLDGNSRPAGSGYDIGCYEYGSTVIPPSSGSSNPLDIVKVYPNPFTLGKTDLKIINLPVSSSVNIKIYNSEGELVKELRSSSISIFWNGKDLEEKYVGMGIYYCLIQDSNGNKKVMRVGVIK